MVNDRPIIRSALSLPQKRRGLLAATCLAMVLGMLVIGLWPFNYLPRNQVSWLDEVDGIRFAGRGLAAAYGLTDWPTSGFRGKEMTLEIFLQPDRTYHWNRPRILSLCDREGREVLYLGQWKNSLIVCLADTSSRSRRIQQEVATSDILFPGKPVLLTLVSSNGDTSILADGILLKMYKGFDMAGWASGAPVHYLVLGNSPSGDSPWQGDILRMTVFDCAPDTREVPRQLEEEALVVSSSSFKPAEASILYRFSEREGETARNLSGGGWDLRIERTLSPLRRVWLSCPSREFVQKRTFLADAAVNFFGFAILGAALGAYFSVDAHERDRFSPIFLPVLIGTALSLLIETNQAFLVSRDSSLVDLLLNTLGTSGGALAARIHGKIHHSSTDP